MCLNIVSVVAISNIVTGWLVWKKYFSLEEENRARRRNVAMSISSPVNWVPWIPWLGVGYVSWDALQTSIDSSSKTLVGFVYLAIYLLSVFWQGQVTKVVPDPYLDEIFHIPQAQAYCSGDFHIWDPKLTTPPGLYAFATLFGNLGGIRSCNVYILRLFNVFALIATMAYASDCRALISRGWKEQPKDEREEPEKLSPKIMHTAFNIALFSPLFFFSGLFYTDVLSTCVVLRMYRLFLQRKGPIQLYVAGLLALTMRQTNIFWVAVFMSGLEVVRTIKSIEPVRTEQGSKPQTWQEIAISEFQRYSRGEIHDIPLYGAELQDFVLCAISIIIAVLYHPILILQKIWPYIALLVSFASFVFWNGGVVLGDKSNHVATIHLPQLLYLSAFIAFFSFPLLIPSIISFLRPFFSLLIPSLASKPSSSASPLTWKILFTSTFILISLLATLLTIHFNTLIHPFTLADNRHYVFYVFRYTILFHPLIRYLLAPVYLLCFWLSYRTLSTPFSSPSTSEHTPPSKNIGGKTEIQRLIHERSHNVGTVKADDGPTTSFFMIWILATALSLITAPLVEPRYFIIPWVMWRLHVPSYSASPANAHKGASSGAARRGGRKGGLGESVKFWAYKGYDYRLWMETAWFLAINAATGYVFLYRGFSWPQEPGLVQRFMW